jgi:bifunctional UDP-N-acetylglucosamine pyrophosphorylase/glucosamine-1-phosphate N-acetyltransferase
MSNSNTAAIVLAAGLGTRMKSNVPKVLHPIAGREMILQVLDSLSKISPEKIVLVIGPEMNSVSAVVAAAGYRVDVVVQQDRLGTGHAVQQAEKILSGYSDNVLILYGDSPLITSNTMENMLQARSEKTNPAVVVLGFRPFDPAEYGRLALDEIGNLKALLEVQDADDHELAIDFCNSG